MSIITLSEVQLFFRNAPGNVREKIIDYIEDVEGGFFITPATVDEEDVVKEFLDARGKLKAGDIRRLIDGK